MKAKLIVFLFLFLFLTNCNSYKQEKADARKLVDGGEWIVKYTDSDKIAPKGVTFGSACDFTCKNGVGGLDIRVGKKTDPNDTGEEVFCVEQSHPQYVEFVRLRNGDKVSFEYSDTPLQEKCFGEAMFVKPK